MSDIAVPVAELSQRERGWSGYVAGVIAICAALFHLWTAFAGTLPTMQQVYIHLGFALVLIFLLNPVFGPESRLARLRWPVDAALIGLSVAISAYAVINFLEIAERGAGDPTPVAVVLGVVATLVIIEATRRVLGWALPVLSSVFILYAFVGPWLPGLLAHRGFDIERLSATFYLSTNGIAGTPLQVSSTYIAVFVIFAAFLDVSGAGKFFIDWSYAGLAWMRGGPAKVAVLASAMMGTINGSAVANTVATGTFTIPVMKRAGLRATFAGAVEAASSSGGQIVPPVMGAAAFIMVEILGEPYSKIMTAAIMPALLYYFALLLMIDFEVAGQGIRGVPRSELPSAWGIFRKGWYLVLPLVLLIWMLVYVGYTPLKSAFYGVMSVIVVSWASRATGMGPKKILAALEQGGKGLLEVAAACACAGITIGVLMVTGLALRMSGILIDLSGGNLMVLLVLTMLISIILGMGLPTSAVYIVLAALVVPAMTRLGVDPLAAHLFVFYFGVMANVTPPVAIAAYAGAAIAGADATRTGLIAFRLAFAGFLLPFFWVFNPALILQGDTASIILAVATAVIGITAFAAALQNYLFGARANLVQRLVLGAGALLLLKPGLASDAAGLGLIALSLGWRFVTGGLPLRNSEAAQ